MKETQVKRMAYARKIERAIIDKANDRQKFIIQVATPIFVEKWKQHHEASIRNQKTYDGMDLGEMRDTMAFDSAFLAAELVDAVLIHDETI